MQKLERSMRKLFCKWKYLKPIIILVIAYGGGSLFYFGVLYAYDEIGTNKIISGLSYGVNMLIAGIM